MNECKCIKCGGEVVLTVDNADIAEMIGTEFCIECAYEVLEAMRVEAVGLDPQ